MGPSLQETRGFRDPRGVRGHGDVLFRFASLCPRRFLCVFLASSSRVSVCSPFSLSLPLQPAFIATLISGLVLLPAATCSLVREFAFSDGRHPTLSPSSSCPELLLASNCGHALFGSQYDCSPKHKNASLLPAAASDRRLPSFTSHSSFSFRTLDIGFAAVVFALLQFFLRSIRFTTYDSAHIKDEKKNTLWRTQELATGLLATWQMAGSAEQEGRKVLKRWQASCAAKRAPAHTRRNPHCAHAAQRSSPKCKSLAVAWKITTDKSHLLRP